MLLSTHVHLRLSHARSRQAPTRGWTSLIQTRRAGRFVRDGRSREYNHGLIPPSPFDGAETSGELESKYNEGKKPMKTTKREIKTKESRATPIPDPALHPGRYSTSSTPPYRLSTGPRHIKSMTTTETPISSTSSSNRHPASPYAR